MAKFNHKTPQTIRELKSQPFDINTSERLNYIHNRIRASAYTKKPEVRFRILQRDNYHCVQCGSTNNLTIDHIVSIYRGGTNKDTNLQTLCNSCNSRKSP